MWTVNKGYYKHDDQWSPAEILMGWNDKQYYSGTTHESKLSDQSNKSFFGNVHFLETGNRDDIFITWLSDASFNTNHAQWFIEVKPLS